MGAAIFTQGFTSEDFRAALGAFTTGVTVITTAAEGHPYGMTANAFSSVSLDPPLVLVCVRSDAGGSGHIQTNRCFAVNILGAQQEATARYFSWKDRPRGPDSFLTVPHRTGPSGSPLLEGAAAHLDCALHASHSAGDHEIFIGEVVSLAVDPAVPPLLFHQGRYRFVSGE